MIKFNKYNVTDTETGKKARVHYSADNHVSCFTSDGTRNGSRHVTIYAKDYDNCLHEIIPQGFEDNSDLMTDYMEKGLIRLNETHPLFDAAYARATA